MRRLWLTKLLFKRWRLQRLRGLWTAHSSSRFIIAVCSGASAWCCGKNSFFFLGGSKPGCCIVATVNVFDLNSNAWLSSTDLARPNLPQARMDAGCAVIIDKFYVLEREMVRQSETRSIVLSTCTAVRARTADTSCSDSCTWISC